MKKLLAWLDGSRTWKYEWQEALSEQLKTAQQDLNMSVVVVVARESDLYTEILYFLSFLGLGVGTVAAFWIRSAGNSLLFPDPLIFPLMGYTVGSLFHVGRRYFLKRWFVRLARAKVYAKADAYFLDYLHKLQGKIALLYFSETEALSALIANPEIQEKLPRGDITKILRKLELSYSARNPLEALTPALENISILLQSYAPNLDSAPKNFAPPLYVGASDKKIKLIPILKGNKDIN